MTRSRASSKSRLDSAWPLRRAQKIAASLQMFARSAPVRPLVWAATRPRSTSSRSGLSRVWTREDPLAALDVGRRDEDLAVEAPRAQQRRVELLEQVRGGHHDEPAGRREAVHLDEQLVERLLALGVVVRAAARADGVELVDEDDGRRVLARLVEEAPDPRRAEAGEHLDERRRRLAEELRARLVGDGLGQQRLAGAGRPVEQDALGDPGAEAHEAASASRRNSTTSRSSSLASSTPAMSSQPISWLAWGLICTGFVFGMSFSVRKRTKTSAPMKRIPKAPLHWFVKSWIDWVMLASATAPSIGTAGARTQAARSARSISSSAARPTSSWASLGSRVPTARWSSWPGRRSARATRVPRWRSDQAKTSTAAPAAASWTPSCAACPGRSTARRRSAAPARLAASSGARRCEPQRSCSLAAVARVAVALLVGGDRLVLDAVVGRDLAAAQREEGGQERQGGHRGLGPGPRAAPAHGRAARRGRDGGERHARVLEGQPRLGQRALDERHDRERLGQPRHAAHARGRPRRRRAGAACARRPPRSSRRGGARPRPTSSARGRAGRCRAPCRRGAAAQPPSRSRTRSR